MPDLYPYQKIGVAWLKSRKRGLLADEPGLGKTAQTLLALTPPALVICPAVVKSVWESEIKKWRPNLTCQVLYSSDQPNFRMHDVVICNYDILPELPARQYSSGANIADRALAWLGTKLGTLIADEAHYLKNHKAQRTISFRALTRNADRTWLLTGTPMLGTPLDLKGVLTSGGLFAEAFADEENEDSDFDNFIELFHGRNRRFGGYDWGKPSPEVYARLLRVMLRRTKSQVGLQLPEKTYQQIPVELSRELTGEHAAALEEIDLDNLPDEIGRLAELRAKTALAKIKACVALVDEFEKSDVPLLVFCAHTAPLDILAKREGWLKLDGSTPEEKRGAIVARFQRGELRGLACNIKAAGVGITLTRSNTAIFIDREWTPALNEQAENRIHRIGQRDACTYIDLIAETELEKIVWGVLRRKQKLINAAIEGKA